MAKGITCLVTIHGIGFQHAPQDGSPGYADGLHDRLKQRPELAPLLSGDPAAEFGRPVGQGAVYVHSDWPPGSGKVDEGLKRLGRWGDGDASHRQVDITGVPLVQDGYSIAHVALVYTGLEEKQSHLGASLETLAKVIVSHGKYASLSSLLGMGVMDLWATLQHQRHGTPTMTPSLQVRPGAGNGGAKTDPAEPSSPLAVIQQLDGDVTTYVCRNDLRERVRSFLHDAILRICFREDVEKVVINSHSLGTVLAFDVLRTLPPIAARRVGQFITAGSPLRKFADIFYWGTDASCIYQMPWSNFWDDTDPVADPLEPPASWLRGTPLPQPTGESLLYSATDPDTGKSLSVRMTDYLVHNADHGAGGSLPAHNYWDNEDEFVTRLAGLLRETAADRAESSERN